MRVNTPLSFSLVLSECASRGQSPSLVSHLLRHGLDSEPKPSRGAMTALIFQFALPLMSCLSVLALLFYSALALVTVDR